MAEAEKNNNCYVNRSFSKTHTPVVPPKIAGFILDGPRQIAKSNRCWVQLRERTRFQVKPKVKQ